MKPSSLAASSANKKEIGKVVQMISFFISFMKERSDSSQNTWGTTGIFIGLGWIGNRPIGHRIETYPTR